MATDLDPRADLEYRSIPALCLAAAERFGEREAIVDGDLRCTFAELATAALSAARAFTATGLRPGDRVAIWAPNCWEWVVAMLGAQFSGGVLVPLNTRFKGAEAAYVLRRSGATILCTVSGFLGVDYPSLLDGHDIGEVRDIVLLRGEVGPDVGPAPSHNGSGGAPARVPPTTWWDFQDFAQATEPDEVLATVAALGPDDVADIIFTSGTTGAPKGVVATHGQALRAFGTWSTIMGLGAQDRYLLVNPMFHTFGYKAGIVACLLTGATMVPLQTFDVDRMIDLIESERITMLPGPPTIYQTLLHHPRRRSADLSSLRLAATGAAVIPTTLVEQMWNELGITTVITAYGLTEACGFVTACRQGDSAETIARTSGRAIPGVEVRIVGDDGAAIEPGSELAGEVVCRGYNVMRGYFDDPEQTAEAIDADGWLHTGDVATMDQDGNIKIVDRLKDMFIVGGFNAYPAEIESLLLAHPAIAQAAVVGVPDERLGEVGVAYVILAEGSDATGPELVAWAREHMANYKAPSRVHVVDSLPMNVSGKVLKTELRDRPPD